jgi:hypothetical protein
VDRFPTGDILSPNKLTLMAFTFFVGIDIGKETLEVALFKEAEELQVITVANDVEAIKAHLLELKKVPGFVWTTPFFAWSTLGFITTLCWQFYINKKRTFGWNTLNKSSVVLG